MYKEYLQILDERRALDEEHRKEAKDRVRRAGETSKEEKNWIRKHCELERREKRLKAIPGFSRYLEEQRQLLKEDLLRKLNATKLS